MRAFDPGGFSRRLSLVLASLRWVKLGRGDLSALVGPQRLEVAAPELGPLPFCRWDVNDALNPHSACRTVV